MKIDYNEFYRQATTRICSTLNLDTALKNTFEFIRDYIPVQQMHLAFFDPGLKLIHIVSSVTSGNAMDDYNSTESFPLPEEVKNKWLSPSQKMVEIVNQPASDPEMAVIFRKLGRKTDISVINALLELEGHRLGAIELIATGNDRYTEKHRRLIQLIQAPLSLAFSNTLNYRKLVKLKDSIADENKQLRKELLELSGSVIIGARTGLREVMDSVRQVAPLDSSVLLLGETGVGKDVIANSIHYSSKRKDGPFIKVNCGAIPDTLLDSELFGHEKGAYTGAITQKRGRFERAHQGTIFLDEIGELSLQAQVKLLDVIQNKKLERLGGTETIPVDVRIISATNKNLQNMVNAGQFREDLWFRLNVFPITILPLRLRKEDIPLLVQYFVEKKSRDLKLGPPPRISPGELDRFMTYHWPGNVRVQ